MILEICEKALWVFDFMYAYWKTWRNTFMQYRWKIMQMQKMYKKTD